MRLSDSNAPVYETLERLEDFYGLNFIAKDLPALRHLHRRKLSRLASV